jgi:hypothetical protein
MAIEVRVSREPGTSALSSGAADSSSMSYRRIRPGSRSRIPGTSSRAIVPAAVYGPRNRACALTAGISSGAAASAAAALTRLASESPSVTQAC